jgi:hypothetical protein
MMKTVIKLFVIAFAGLYCLAGCKDMDSIHEQYAPGGEIIYTGMVEYASVYSGVERIGFSWYLNADPRIVSTVIYWNEGADSVVVPVNRTDPGYMEMNTVINLPEGFYQFELVTKDREGHRSIGLNETGQVYGVTYQSGLKTQNILPNSYLSDRNWYVFLSETERNAVYTEIEYEERDGTKKTLEVPVPVRDTVIPNAAPEAPFRYRTFYMEDNYMEPVPSIYTEGATPAVYRNEIRPVTVATKFGNGYAVALGTVKNTYSDFFYTDLLGNEVQVRALASDPAVYLYNCDGSGFSQIASYVSESLADTFRTEKTVYTGTVNDRSVTATSSTPAIISPGNFDLGGEGIGFHDSDNVHQGIGGVNYRTNLGDYLSAAMDIDGAAGSISYTASGEWLSYTINVQDAGNYEIDWYVSVNNAAGGSCHVEVDGVASEIFQMVTNSSWSAWRYYCERNSVAPPVYSLAAGRHTVKFVWHSNTFYYNGMRMTYKP